MVAFGAAVHTYCCTPVLHVIGETDDVAVRGMLIKGHWGSK
jgi:hypothetical protein